MDVEEHLRAASGVWGQLESRGRDGSERWDRQFSVAAEMLGERRPVSMTI